MSVLITFGLFFALNVAVFALAPCNTDIIQNIRNKNGCALGNVLEQTFKASPHILRGFNEETLSSTLRCVSSSSRKPEGKTAQATITHSFKDGSQMTFEATLEEEDCGKVLEYHTNNTVYELHFVTLRPVVAYYMCSEKGTDAYHSGNCDVPLARQDDEGIEDALTACKSMLENIGISSMTIVDHCTL